MGMKLWHAAALALAIAIVEIPNVAISASRG